MIDTLANVKGEFSKAPIETSAAAIAIAVTLISLLFKSGRRKWLYLWSLVHRLWARLRSKPAPKLFYDHVTSGDQWNFSKGPHNLLVMVIRNVQISFSNTANNVSARIEYRHSLKIDRYIVDKALWRINAPGRHALDPTCFLEGNEGQQLVLIVQEPDGRWLASMNQEYIVKPLEHGHWKVRVTITGDNFEPLRLVGGFTLLPDNQFLPDMPKCFQNITFWQRLSW